VNVLNGLDGKSVLVGGALVVGAIAAAEGGLFPALLIGGIVYVVGVKKGWWGQGPWQGGSELMRHAPAAVPPFFAEWHRQAHAADAAYHAAGRHDGAQAAAPDTPAWNPAPAAPAPAPKPAAPAETPAPAASAQPQDVEVRIPVTTAPTAPAASAEPVAGAEADYRRTVGENGSPLA